METIQNHGFISDELIEGDHYVLGGYTGIQDRPVLMPTGHGWKKYLPTPELQNRSGLETMNCSNYGTHNALETLAKFLGFMDFPDDCSERYSGVGTHTDKDGNSPHLVIELIRDEIGVIPESVLPWSENITTWDEYYSPKPLSADYLNMGRKILEKFDIKHEWVFNGLAIKNKQEKLVYALERGTVSVSVLAWREGDKFYTKDFDESDNHWVQLVDYKDGQYWEIFDHYDKVFKKLEWGYNFECSKIYYMYRKVIPPTPLEKLQMQLVSLLIQLRNAIASGIRGLGGKIFTS